MKVKIRQLPASISHGLQHRMSNRDSCCPKWVGLMYAKGLTLSFVWWRLLRKWAGRHCMGGRRYLQFSFLYGCFVRLCAVRLFISRAQNPWIRWDCPHLSSKEMERQFRYFPHSLVNTRIMALTITSSCLSRRRRQKERERIYMYVL